MGSRAGRPWQCLPNPPKHLVDLVEKNLCFLIGIPVGVVEVETASDLGLDVVFFLTPNGFCPSTRDVASTRTDHLIRDLNVTISTIINRPNDFLLLKTHLNAMLIFKWK